MCLLLTPLVPSLSAWMFYRHSHTRTVISVRASPSLPRVNTKLTTTSTTTGVRQDANSQRHTDPLPSRPPTTSHLSFHLLFSFTTLGRLHDFNEHNSHHTAVICFPLHLVLVSSFCTNNFYFPFGCTASLFTPISPPLP
ncbi:hypothetical protein BGY98DRAFT_970231 [Russula aff. rugulosa BPL654]|nr:hypothetical protein BGY98DRAFT_970231 [Russula aff. rugulosa BPL654]